MSTDNQPTEFIGEVEAVAVLEVTRSTFRHWCAKGHFPVVGNGPGATSGRRYRRADILAAVSELTP